MGRLAIDRGDIERARQLLAAAMRAAPNDRQVRQLDGDIAFAAGENEAAERIYRKILVAEPWNELIRGQLATVLVAEDKLPEAVSTVDAVLLDPRSRDIPKHPLLNYVRALAAFRQQDYATAQSNAAAVVAKVPGFERARLMAGASSYALHAYEQAYYYLSPYVSEHPEDIAARKLLAATQLRLGRTADAAATLGPLKNEATDDVELLQLIGEASARGGDIATARRYLALALKHEPDNGMLRTQLGIAELAAGDAGAAIRNLERVAATDPAASLPDIPLFAAFMQMKDYAQALATAEKAEEGRAVRADRRAVDRRRLSESGQGAGRAGGAVEGPRYPARRYRLERDAGGAGAGGRQTGRSPPLFPGDSRRHPDSAGTYIALAELEAKTGHDAAAEAVLLKGVAAAAASPDIAVALARLQLRLGEAEKALAGATEALKKFPRNPALLEIVGTAQLALGQTDEALSTFKNLIDVAPDLASGHTGLAKVYLAQFRPDNPQWPAVNEAMQAVTLAPQDTEAKLVLARALAVHGRFAEAGDLVQELRRVKPQDAELLDIAAIVARGQGRSAEAAADAARAEALQEGAARRHLAEQLVQNGDTDQAVKNLTDWLDAHSDDSETRNVLAELCVNTGRLAEARTHYLRLAAQDPKNPVYQNNLAWVLARLERWQEALPYAKSAATLQPGAVEFLDTLGAILLQTGKPAEALGPLESAWSKAADRPDIGYHYSQALAAAGRKEEALAVLRRVLDDGDANSAERDQAQSLLRKLGG